MKAFNETEVDLLEDDDLDTLKAQRIKEMKAEAMRLQVPLFSGPCSSVRSFFSCSRFPCQPRASLCARASASECVCVFVCGGPCLAILLPRVCLRLPVLLYLCMRGCLGVFSRASVGLCRRACVVCLLYAYTRT